MYDFMRFNKKYFTLLLLLLLKSIAGSAFFNCNTTTADTTFYKGWVADKYSITVMLVVNNNKVKGWYFYDSKKQKLNIKGIIQQQHISFTEYFGADTTGFFDGNIDDSNHISGVWSKTNAEDDDSKKYFQIIRQPYYNQVFAIVNAAAADTTAKKINILSYDATFNIVLNTAFIKTCAEPVKAILAYYSTQSGSHCWWDKDEPDSNYSNLSCQFTAALGLGYQCSVQQKNFIKQWFAGDTEILSDIENCYSAPYTATVQHSFNMLSVTQWNNKVLVRYQIQGANLREGTSYTYNGIGIFRIEKNRVVREYFK